MREGAAHSGPVDCSWWVVPVLDVVDWVERDEFLRLLIVLVFDLSV